MLSISNSAIVNTTVAIICLLLVVFAIYIGVQQPDNHQQKTKKLVSLTICLFAIIVIGFVIIFIK